MDIEYREMLRVKDGTGADNLEDKLISWFISFNMLCKCKKLRAPWSTLFFL